MTAQVSKLQTSVSRHLKNRVVQTRGKLLDAYALSRKTKPLDGFPMFRFEELPVCSEKSGA